MTMSDQVLFGVLAAIVFAFQAQAGLKPVIWLPANMPLASLCTGVDLNIGCQPAELTPEAAAIAQK